MVLETTNSPSPVLDENLIVRPVTLDDVENAVRLHNLHNVEYYGHPCTTAAELTTMWSAPGFDLPTSTRAVFTPSGEMIAYEQIWEATVPVRPELWGYVHPDYRGRGIASHLLHWAEERARQAIERVPQDARVVLETSTSSTDEASKQLLGKVLGMQPTGQSWWEMIIEMDSEPAPAQWAEGISVTTLAELDDMRAVYTAVRGAFKDHRGYVDSPFEEGFNRWHHYVSNDELYDPTLYFLAVSGDQIVGVSLCRSKGWSDPTTAYVDTLGVVEEFRHRGIGEALLRHSFAEFWQRDLPRVTLHVDGSSLTGANRLYERVGMRILRAFDAYEKELRPGREISRQ
jgi:mycothiol synthase